MIIETKFLKFHLYDLSSLSSHRTASGWSDAGTSHIILCFIGLSLVEFHFGLQFFDLILETNLILSIFICLRCQFLEFSVVLLDFFQRLLVISLFQLQFRFEISNLLKKWQFFNFNSINMRKNEFNLLFVQASGWIVCLLSWHLTRLDPILTASL